MNSQRQVLAEMGRRVSGAVKKLGKKLPDVLVVATGEVVASIALALFVGGHLA